MIKETLRFEDMPALITDLVTEVKALRLLFEDRIQHMTPKEPPVSRKVVMERLGTTAPTLLSLERAGKITKLRLQRRAFYNFSEVVAAMKKPNRY